MLILGLDHTGVPRRWLTIEDAVSYIAKDSVAWSIGEPVKKLYGGWKNNGERSWIETPSIIAVKANTVLPKKIERNVPLSNFTLFGRDHRVCAYCGNQFSKHDLSRDHIKPRSRGGKDVWMNVVTACRKCNQRKADKTPEEANMQLVYIPYVPNYNEAMILQNRNILTDQMDFLLSGVSKDFIQRMEIYSG